MRKSRTAFAWAVALWAAVVAGPAFAWQEGGATNAPGGWTVFCLAYATECRADAPATHDALSWADVVRVNRRVNEAIKPLSDPDHWGLPERWSIPTDGYGDCEDYALLKRKLLLSAGWPRDALLMTVVRDRHGELHAVLTVVTDKGEYVLDNQTNSILAPQETGHTPVKRQSRRDPDAWVKLLP